ncbi:hypothetical protein KSP35_00025 [Aquihabitans sp. G128]|nr:hypothetical protein [Aquihabitans sp. G128]QXC61282.1 hypothetical protein KSP35_00025 [Aquihabitans sp. G128]
MRASSAGRSSGCLRYCTTSASLPAAPTVERGEVEQFGLRNTVTSAMGRW